MNYSIHRISLDIHDTASQVSVSVKKGNNTRKIIAVLTENGKPYNIAHGVRAVFRAKKPADSNGYRAIVYNDAEIVNNAIHYTLTSENTEVEGVADCEFTLYGQSGEVLTSPRLTLIVYDTVNTDDDVLEVGSNEVTALTALVSETSALKDEIETKLENGEFVGEQGVQGEKGDKGDKGDTGPAGYTPVKGVDYYTEADRKEFYDKLTPALHHFANAVKGTASGEVVVIDDVSPVEHTAKVLVHGKNLFDISQIANNAELTNNGDGTLTVVGGSYSVPTHKRLYELCPQLKVGDVCVLSLKTTSSYSTFIHLIETGITWDEGKNITVTEKALNSVVLVYGRHTSEANFGQETVISNIQIELGTTATDYVPYLDPTTATLTVQNGNGESIATYTTNADGTCDVVSVYPTMTLLTDKANTIIECEYNRDANKVVADLLAFITQSTSIAYIDLPSAKWVGTASPYSQVVSINGITENSKIDLNPSVEQLAIFHEKDIAFVAENEDGVVTVYCIGQKPTIDYSMQITITEVAVNG